MNFNLACIKYDGYAFKVFTSYIVRQLLHLNHRLKTVQTDPSGQVYQRFLWESI